MKPELVFQKDKSDKPLARLRKRVLKIKNRRHYNRFYGNTFIRNCLKNFTSTNCITRRHG